MDPSVPVSHNTLYSFIWRQRERGIIPVVTNRDLRRTGKTLAGKAGVMKEIRDRIRNHALHDVSSKNYDRWNYMPGKRGGMKKWYIFITALLSKGAEPQSRIMPFAQQPVASNGRFAPP